MWLEEFSSYDRRLRAEMTAPLQNKIGQFLMSPMVRNIFGQTENKIDPRFTMDRRRIFIANLAKGKIGDDKPLEWSKITTFAITLTDTKTKRKINLASPGGTEVLKRIELVKP